MSAIAPLSEFKLKLLSNLSFNATSTFHAQLYLKILLSPINPFEKTTLNYVFFVLCKINLTKKETEKDNKQNTK